MSFKRRLDKLEREAEKFMEGRYKKVQVWKLLHKIAIKEGDSAELMAGIINIQLNK